MKIAITGATGFIGRALVQVLAGRGDTVLVLTRRPAVAEGSQGKAIQAVQWTPRYDPTWGQQLAGCDAVINLAGEPIFGRRWTQRQKERILKSRTEATAGIVEAIRRSDPSPQVLINASAVGFYGPHGDEFLDEASSPGEDFLARVCRAWENEVAAAQLNGPRTVIVRTGIVLGKGGGVLEKMVPQFRKFLGGPLGSGQQWVSWIHLEDLVGMYLWALSNPKITGPINGTAPNPITNRDFTRTLGHALRRPAWFSAPAIALRLAFGEAAQTLLSGQRVLPRRPMEMGFAFRFPILQEALNDILTPA